MSDQQELLEILKTAAKLIEDVTHFPFGEPMTPLDIHRRACSTNLRMKIKEMEKVK